MCNDTIEDYDFTWYGTKTYPVEHWPNGNFDSTGAYTTYETETKDWPATKGTDGKINGNQVTISTKDKPAEEENLKLTITTSKGQTIQCAVKVIFTPGDYTFGKIGFSYTNQGYMGWGKYKGKYPNSAEYVEYCGDKEKYDKYKSFFDNQTLRDGTTGTLEDLAAQTRDACGERSLYKSKARLEWEALSYEVQQNTYDDNFYYYVRKKYGEAGYAYHNIFCHGGFDGCITSNAQLKQIVDNWTRVSGEVPSWYYYTAFSDWAEWSGRDLGLLNYSDGQEIPLPPNYKD